MENIVLNQEMIRTMAGKAVDGIGFIVDLYTLAVPGFSECKEIKGYPKVNTRTACFIMAEAARAKMAGFTLMWLNKGFGTSDEVADWQIDNSGVTLIF